MGSLDAYRRNVYSQNGEDGVLAEILRRLGIERGVCVDVGANDGENLSNVRHLIDQGWRAVLIERNRECWPALRALSDAYPRRVSAICAAVNPVGSDCLDEWLDAVGDAPPDFDLLNIDIDGDDLGVWRGLTVFRPKIVIIEINSGVPLGVRQEHGNGNQGASFTSMLDVATAKGYRLVCHTGNCIFVDEPLFPRLWLPADDEFPESLFNYAGPQ